jgi:NDP-sugar pyrophosphorylase family protein
MRAVILAGGLGTRLKPYTTSLPKPLMPINGEMPILEVVLRQLKRDGFTHATLAVGHLHEIIRAFFGDGRKWGMTVDYSLEEKPLSTIGPLTLIDDLPDHFLVMNGDILSDISFRSLMEHHGKTGADVTVAVYRRNVKVDYGVLDYREGRITGFSEKPEYSFDVSMGIYAISRNVIDGLARGERYGFDNLMVDGIANGSNLSAYPYDGYWLDIGRPDDFDRANEEFSRMREIFLGAEG